MLKMFLIIFFVTLSSINCQTSDQIKLCFAMQGNSFSSDRTADLALNKILAVTGLSKRFVLAPCSEISNCLAISYKGIRYILFDKNFMKSITSQANDWANLSILAHEVGHHINGHSIDVLMYAGEEVDRPTLEASRQMELEADEFSGFVMAKLGATLNQASKAIEIMAVEEDDTYSTHPKKSRRLKAISKGYKNAGVVNKVEYVQKKGSKISVEEVFNIARSKQAANDYVGAINEYSKAIRIKPDYTFAYNNRGFLKFKLKDFTGAINDYSKVIKIDPGYATAYYNRASAKKNIKDYYGALSDYNSALKIRPDYAIAYNNRGNIKYNLKDFKGAINDYTKAIKFKAKGPVKIFTNRGVSKESLGDIKGACNDWKVAARLGGKNAQKWILEQCN